MKKKSLTLFLVFLMLLPTFAMAVDYGFNVEGFPIVNEEITVTCLFPRSANQPTDFSDMYLVRTFREKLGINLKFDLVESSAFNERKALALASGDYSDIFFGGITAEDEAMYGAQGIFIDLSELIEKYAPNFTALMEEFPEIHAAITSEDGAIYSMPVIYTAGRDRVTPISYINMAWIKNVGKEMPTTLNELYDLLVAFRDQDANGNGDNADEKPLTYPAGSLEFKRTVLAALGIVGEEDDVIDGQYIFVPASEQYKEYLKYMNRLYDEKLLDPNVFILSAEEYATYLSNDMVGIGSATDPYVYVEDYAERYTVLPMLTSDSFTEHIWPGQQFVYRNTGNFVITDKCQYPEAMVRMADYCFSVEGSLMVRSGPEDGVWGGEGGWHVIKDAAGNELRSEINFDTNKYSSYYNFREQQSPMAMPYNSSDYMGFIMTAGDPKASWSFGLRTTTRPLTNLKINYPLVMFSSEEQDVLNTCLTDMRNYVSSMEVKFVTGEVSIDDTWDEYISTLNRMGMEKVIAVKQAAYDRFISK